MSSGDSIDSVAICSNNPLIVSKPEVSSQKINLSPGFTVKSWNSSYVNGGYNNSYCNPNEFVTFVSGDVVPGTRYTGALTLTDVFGSTATQSVDFTTRALRNEDYKLEAYQDRSVVTVPSKTKLTFGARFIPEITATVCKMRAYDFYNGTRDMSSTNAPICESTVSRTITLPGTSEGQVMFSIDIKDYFPNVVGNYAVTLSTPLIPSQWRYPTRTYVSVTNMIVTEKRIAPVERNAYDTATLTSAQVSQLQNMYWIIDATTQAPVAGASVNLYRDGSVVRSATTNAQGIAFVTSSEDIEVMIATFGGDSTTLSGAQTVNYASNAANIKNLYMYTDKPLYRPGQEIHIKGIYRSGYDGYYQVPVQQTLKLQVRDSADKVISEQNVTTNSYGTIASAVTLPEEAVLGSYRACIEYNCTYFDVLNYVPAAFRVAFDDGVEEIFAGTQPKESGLLFWRTARGCLSGISPEQPAL
jgi:hypothetical protein